MRVNIISRKPFESKTYSYVTSITVSGDNLSITTAAPQSAEVTVTYDRHEVVLNVNTRED